MNPVAGLPIVQIHDLLHRPERNEQRHDHNKPLHIQIPHLHEQMRHERQQQPDDRVQEPDREPFSPELHPGPLVEENQLVRVIPIGQKHRHFPNYVVHRAGNAEEVNENRAGEPELGIVKQGLAFHDLLDREGDPNQDREHDEGQLLGGEERRPVNRTDVELGLGLDEIGHRLGESREIALVHLLRLLGGVVRSDEADVREGIDAEESEALLRLFELDVAEEEVGVARARVRVVGEEGLGEEREFGVEGFELELRLVVELGGIEEDEEVVGSWGFRGGEVARDGVVVEVDNARFGSGLEGLELRDSVRVGGAG